jgi:hypothetical protein
MNAVKEWWRNLTRKQRWALWIGIGVLVLGLVLGGLAWWQNRERLMQIGGLEEATAGRPQDAQTLAFIKGLLLQTINLNVETPLLAHEIDDAVIREGTFDQTDDEVHEVTFIVDIPSLQQSYNVSYQWTSRDSTGQTQQYGTMIWCPQPEQLIWPAFNCRDILSMEAEGAGGSGSTGIVGADSAALRAALPIVNPVFSITYNTDFGQFQVQVRVAQANLNEAISRLRRIPDVTLAEHDIVFDPATPFGGSSNPDGATAAAILNRNYGVAMQNFEVVTQRAVAGYAVVLIWPDEDTIGLNASYRAVFQVTNGGYKLVAAPQPLVTQYNTPDVPIEVLNAANAL